MIAGAELLLVGPVGLIPLEKLPMGFLEVAAEFLFARSAHQIEWAVLRGYSEPK
jgi:hypothetical protein